MFQNESKLRLLLFNFKMTGCHQQLAHLQSLWIINIYRMYIIRKVLEYCLIVKSTMLRVYNLRTTFVPTQNNLYKKLTWNFQFFHDVDISAEKTLFTCVWVETVYVTLSYQFISNHFFSNLFGLFRWIDKLNTTFETIFDKVSVLPTWWLNLSFDHKSRFIMCGSCYVSGVPHCFPTWKGYITQWYWYPVIL